MSERLIDLTLVEKRRTADAILVTDAERSVWLPLSQIEINEAHPKTNVIEITLPEWLAKKRELI
jgi:hypothetical protein